jgi:hypothetical protein
MKVIKNDNFVYKLGYRDANEFEYLLKQSLNIFDNELANYYNFKEERIFNQINKIAKNNKDVFLMTLIIYELIKENCAIGCYTTTYDYYDVCKSFIGEESGVTYVLL